MKKFLALIALFFSYNTTKALFFNIENDLDKLNRKINERGNSFTIPNQIRFANRNLSKKNLSYQTLENIYFYGTDFSGSNFCHAHISGCNFEKTDLSYTDFTKATLWCISNLEKATSIENANFEDAKYLSNKQKQFLRKNGAINVPENDREINFDYDFDPEEFHEKVLAVFKTISNGSKETYNWLKINGHKLIKLLQN